MQAPVTLAITGAQKRFGPIRALDGASFRMAAGEVVGLVGHNGAGKSTLMNLIAGVIRRDAGEFVIGGQLVGPDYTPALAQRLGVRCVFQELSLCGNLDAAENTRVLHRSLRGLGWRGRARRLIGEALHAVFPDSGIPLDAKLGELAIGQRQMVEIARAYTGTREPVSFVILDEPTSSLGHEATSQLLRFVREAAGRGTGSILISHRLNEILEVCDRVAVMVDGQVVAERPAAALTHAELVGLMGNVEPPPSAAGPAARRLGAPVIERPGTVDGELPIQAAAGEVVGFAGLDGHGQRRCLRELFFAEVHAGRVGAAYVAGDRGAEGVFPLWSIADNLTVCSLPRLRAGALLSRAAQRAMALDWVGRMKVKTDGIDRPIVTLSGGNQQKVLFARALATDARIVFLDDPMRGVDVGTRQEVYRMIREEADRGRCFVWFTTETEELVNCDKVYVFRDGRVSARLDGSSVTPGRVIQASFGELSHV